VARARAGHGPTLLECKTYRYYDHVGVRGMGLKYRSDEEVEQWQQRDSIDRIEAHIIEQDIATRRKLDNVHKATQKEVEEGIAFAEASPMPEASALLEDVYA